MSERSTKVIPLGGLEEFGSNSFIFEYADHIILIDFGLQFAKQPNYGVNYLIPDIRYIKSNLQRIQGIVFTHGHLDHIGGIRYLLEHVKIPIYASKFTAMLIHHMLDKASIKDYDLSLLEIGKKIQLGHFNIEPALVDHSIPDAMALKIRTPTGLFIHSGDFRNDKTPYKRKKNDFSSLLPNANEKVLALFSDSTNSPKSGHSVSEQEVFNNLDKIFTQHKRRLIFSTFSTQIDRIRKILDLALKHNRKVFFVGKSMVNNLSIAIRGKFLEEYDKVIRPLGQYKKVASAKSVLIATGSQGEPNSALIKLAEKKHRQIAFEKDDMIVFSSSTIPGNEVSVNDLINRLAKHGYDVITNDDMVIHTSGHGYADELSLLIKKLKPQFFFPIHGNYINLKMHKKLALQEGLKDENIFLIENGQRIEIFNNHVKLTEKIKLQKNLIENERFSFSDHHTFEIREQASMNGVLFVYLLLSENIKKKILSNVSIEMVGITGKSLEEKLCKVIRKFLAKWSSNFELKNGIVPKKVEKTIQTEIRKIISRELGSLPVIRVVVKT